MSSDRSPVGEFAGRFLIMIMRSVWSARLRNRSQIAAFGASKRLVRGGEFGVSCRKVWIRHGLPAYGQRACRKPQEETHVRRHPHAFPPGNSSATAYGHSGAESQVRFADAVATRFDRDDHRIGSQRHYETQGERGMRKKVAAGHGPKGLGTCYAGSRPSRSAAPSRSRLTSCPRQPRAVSYCQFSLRPMR
jgi:hypothetical protein